MKSTNMIKNFSFCESGFLELIFVRSQNFTEAPLYRIYPVSLAQFRTKVSVLFASELTFQNLHYTVVCETKEPYDSTLEIAA